LNTTDPFECQSFLPNDEERIAERRACLGTEQNRSLREFGLVRECRLMAMQNLRREDWTGSVG